MELCLGMDDELAETLWVRIFRQTSVDDMVGLYYRLPAQEETVDKAFKPLEEALC